MLPLSDQLLLKHFGETAPPANSGYGAERRRRRMAELTAETTDRIRIHIDYESLYEETAPRYSACFQVGALTLTLTLTLALTLTLTLTLSPTRRCSRATPSSRLYTRASSASS